MWVPNLGDWSEAEKMTQAWIELRLWNQPEEKQRTMDNVSHLAWLRNSKCPLCPAVQVGSRWTQLASPWGDLLPRRNSGNCVLVTNQKPPWLPNPTRYTLSMVTGFPTTAEWTEVVDGVVVRLTCKQVIIIRCNVEVQIGEQWTHLSPGIRCSAHRKLRRLVTWWYLEEDIEISWSCCVEAGSQGESMHANGRAEQEVRK